MYRSRSEFENTGAEDEEDLKIPMRERKKKNEVTVIKNAIRKIA